MFKKNFVAKFSLLLSVLTAALLSFSGSAHAVVYNWGWCPNRTTSGACDTYGTLTLFYQPNQGGASSSFLGKVYNYDDGNWVFVFGGTDKGAGQGTSVRNNAASGCIDHPSFNYRVFYSPGFSGASQFMVHASCANLVSYMRNNNASQDEA
ncbi:hypothetical protein [Kitasatospora sp. NPDC085879]|uniref:hypothetical protein n=1 Tax=Kitasatospora sp. NPDC085879 TaxID=3154769 RepID=UPI0034385C61